MEGTKSNSLMLRCEAKPSPHPELDEGQAEQRLKSERVSPINNVSNCRRLTAVAEPQSGKIIA